MCSYSANPQDIMPAILMKEELFLSYFGFWSSDRNRIPFLLPSTIFSPGFPSVQINYNLGPIPTAHSFCVGKEAEQSKR